MPFQPYEQDQMTFLPPSLDELVPEGDLVRVINDFVDALPRAVIELKLAKGAGRPSFHPRLMLKVILYAYVSRIYSCRAIARALRQNVYFMWLAGGARPDFNTVNRFRSRYLAPCMEEVFAELAVLLLETGYIKGADFFVDGTKLEADAGRHSYVWRKNVVRHRDRVLGQVRTVLAAADAINAQEDGELGTQDLPECGGEQAATPEEIRAAAGRLADRAKAEPQAAKELEKHSRELEKKADKIAAADQQLQTLGGRNSFSKTDTDATFMRMKDGTLRAGFNLQVGTEGGFVLTYTMAQNASDSVTFPPLMDKHLSALPHPLHVVADAAYGTEENHALLEARGIQSHLQDKTLGAKPGPYDKRSFTYDEERDVYTCPQKQTLTPGGPPEARRTINGYTTQVQNYSTEACRDCPVRALCTRGEQRTIQRNPRLDELIARSHANITSPKGVELRRRRANEVETIFARLKHNQGYRRTRLRGLAKATLDIGYVLLGLNLRKIHLLGGLLTPPRTA